MTKEMNEGFELIRDIFRLKWIPEIIESISNDHVRYTDISDNIDYISNAELNRKLLILQERHIIVKKSLDGKDGYYLTELGEDLDHIFNHFLEMSSKYIEKTSSPELL